MREIQPGMWKCKDGRVIPIATMSDTHLANTIAMLERKGLDKIPVYPDWFPSCNGEMAQMAAEAEWEYAMDHPEMAPNPKYQELILERESRK